MQNVSQRRRHVRQQSKYNDTRLYAHTHINTYKRTHIQIRTGVQKHTTGIGEEISEMVKGRHHRLTGLTNFRQVTLWARRCRRDALGFPLAWARVVEFLLAQRLQRFGHQLSLGPTGVPELGAPGEESTARYNRSVLASWKTVAKA